MNTHTKQYMKFYSWINHNNLVNRVYRLSYDYDYVSKLFEYDDKERHTDYATQHANDYAASHNDYDDFHYMSTHDLWKEYKRISQLWDQFEKTMEVENESRI